jgi:hypothetical protein
MEASCSVIPGACNSHVPGQSRSLQPTDFALGLLWCGAEWANGGGDQDRARQALSRPQRPNWPSPAAHRAWTSRSSGWTKSRRSRGVTCRSRMRNWQSWRSRLDVRAVSPDQKRRLIRAPPPRSLPSVSQNPRHRVIAADGMAWMIDDRGSWRRRTRILYKRRRDGAITTGRRVR